MRFEKLVLLGVVLAVSGLVPAVSAPAAMAAGGAGVQQRQSQEIEDLGEDLEKNERTIERILLPVSVLIGILALGGGLGVVFSIRDQRRVSQLHELTVTGEVSSQRRSEQSYASFLEQSQTTLSLVNDTLELAKEATDRAAKSVEERAQSRVDAIEERAQKLMLDVFTSREFELVVEDPVRRAELHAIGDELRALEGYLSLQDIKLKDYAKFVKALDQFLLNETESALQALQLAAQGQVVGDLQKFIEYWLGYMLTTVGQYEEAIARFEHDEVDLPEDSPQYFQLERIKGETRFFALAKPTPGTESWSENKTDPRGPHRRFEAVASLLDDLQELAGKVAASDSHQAKIHTQLEIARTRADVFEWVAYDEKHLDEPLDKTAIAEASAIVARHPAPENPSDLLDEPLWKELGESDLLRYWALRQAQAICEVDLGEPSVEVDFALAECHFKLRGPGAIEAFEKTERAFSDHSGEHREKRHEVALHQSLLICNCRLFTLRKEAEKEEKERQEQLRLAGKVDEEPVEIPPRNPQEEERHIRQTQGVTKEKLNEMRQRRVTIFSHIQRRNLTQEEFADEVKAIIDQEDMEDNTS